MKLVDRIDGRCDVCSTPFIDSVFEVEVKHYLIVKKGSGETFIEEKPHSRAQLCGPCYNTVHSKLGERR